MKFIQFKYFLPLPFCFFLIVSFTSFEKINRINMPYKKAGLTDREAAAHLLNRFTFGATPEEIDRVVHMGLSNWLEEQLNADSSENDPLKQKLATYTTLKLSNSEILEQYPRNAQIIRQAIKSGIFNKDSIPANDSKKYKDGIAKVMELNNFKPLQNLYREFINQKILRAIYSNNQLKEVLTDFWFNHFNVSITKTNCAEFIPSYERDVIRPRVFSKFKDLLIATAQSPAMLLYLDNASSVGVNKRLSTNTSTKSTAGINENYAREIMELHTLGVDGGYTQQDVIAAAKILTGWTVFPMGENISSNPLIKLFKTDGLNGLQKRGYVKSGDFIFIPTRHNDEEKTVLGHKFKSGGGYDEGLELLNLLAENNSTGKFISTKLARRFVSDNPDPKLIAQMIQVYKATDGDIRKLIITMVESPIFWNKSTIRAKTKSPFELVISAIKVLHADVKQPYQLFNWITKIGQKVYYYQAPTGFPDNGQYWINTGALLSRMNFGLTLAAQKIPGIALNILALNNFHEPESTTTALRIYGNLVLPERDLSTSLNRLIPLLNDTELPKKLASAVPDKTENGIINTTKNTTPDNQTAQLAQVVGVLIGSPEFQRK